MAVPAFIKKASDKAKANQGVQPTIDYMAETTKPANNTVEPATDPMALPSWVPPWTQQKNAQAQPQANAQAPVQQPSNFNYWADKQPVNTNPVQVNTQQTAFAQQQPESQQGYKLFDPMMSQQYNNVIGGMLTGEAFDPMKQANKEALNRAEQQRRSKAADQINRFGGVGQGIGTQIANATESDIMQNRFMQNLEDAKAREALKQQGLGAYENSVAAENNLTNVDRNRVALDNDKVNLDQNRFALQQTKLDTADQISGDFATYIQNSTNLKGATAEQIAADQGAMSKGQAMWESMGGQGQVDSAWVKNMVDRVNDPVLNDTFVQSMNDAQNYLQQGLITQDEFNAISQVNKLALTGGIEVGEDGNLQIKGISQETTPEDKQADSKALLDEILAGTYTPEQIMSDPERLKVAKENAIAVSTGTRVDDRGKKEIRAFSNVPEMNKPFTYNGKTYMRTGDVKVEKLRGKGYDYETYTVVDLDTKQTMTVSSKEGRYSIN